MPSFKSRTVLGLIALFCCVVGGIVVVAVVLYQQYVPKVQEFVISRGVRVVGNRTLTVNTVNGEVPGPALHVRRGEVLRVRVTNTLPDHGVSIHWHGFEMRGVQEFDGVVGVTQCGIAPGETYLYQFVVDEQPGTYWWHSHSDMAPVGHDFIRGPLIVHEAEDLIPQASDDNRYQIGNQITLLYVDEYPNYMGYDHPLTMGGLTASAAPDLEGFNSGALGWTSGTLNGDLQHEVRVQNGEYLVRVINGGGLFPYYFSVDGHVLEVVASDGAPVVPYQTDIIQIHSGERYDVKIKFNITSDRQNIWLRAMTPSRKQDQGILGVIRVRRDGDVEYDDEVPHSLPIDLKEAKILNCVMLDMPDYDCRPITDLKPTQTRPLLDQVIVHVADFLFQFVPQYGHFWSIDGGVWTQNVLPHKAMIMESFNRDTDLHPHTVVVEVPLNTSTTFVIRSVTAFPHPVHLHGHKFEVLATAPRQRVACPDGRCDLVQLETLFSTSVEQLSRTAPTGVLKDTVMVPAGGGVAIRINTDNPGIWFLHCHLDQHMEDGQGFLVEEGPGFSKEALPGDYPSCDYTGRVQTLATAACQCEEREELDERWRMKSTYRCSRPHLCRHVL